jgi:hypothetical protein
VGTIVNLKNLVKTEIIFFAKEVKGFHVFGPKTIWPADIRLTHLWQSFGLLLMG